MRDLDIWRRLHGGAATPADLAEIAALPLSRRCAYVGAVHRLVAHEDPALRAAALRALAGVRGVENVRSIVLALDDADADVRAAAIEALREVARDAPVRYAHALFHPRVEVRRAALTAELPTALAELAMYLRTDPACADLAATKAKWPAESLALGFALYGSGHVQAAELMDLVANHTPGQLREFLLRGRRRDASVLATYLDEAADAYGTIPAPPGHDELDLLVRALASVDVRPRALEHFMETVVAAKQKQLVRRAAVALLGLLARDPAHPTLWAACVALEPRVLALRGFPVEQAPAAVDGLFRYKWPMRVTTPTVKRLLALPHVQGDLALAAAVAGLAGAKRLQTLAGVLGELNIVERLLADDHGWDELCRLPPESGALELAWLARVEARDYKRYIVLAGRALGVFAGARLGMFVENMPRRHRPSVFLAALMNLHGATDERLIAVCKTVAGRIDRQGLAMMIPALLDFDPSGRLVLGVARFVSDKVLAGAGADLSDSHVVQLVSLLDGDPIPRDREVALARVFRERGIVEVQEWCDTVDATTTAPVAIPAPIVRVRRELTTVEGDRIASCPDSALETALAPALGGAVTGLCRALDRREAKPNVWACAALLACADPLEDVARVLDRFADVTPAFDVALDNAMCNMARVVELPPLAQARLWRWEQQLFRFVEWVEAAGGTLAALQITEQLRGRLARRTLWQAISEGLMLLRYRQMPRFRTHASLELALFATEHIDTENGRHAARIVVALVESGVVPVSAVRDRVLDRIADADGETRSFAARLVRLEGVPEAPAVAGPPPMPLVEEIRAATDLDALATWCMDPRPSIVQEAALVLVALGAPGQLRLAELLAAEAPPAPIPILATLVLWDHTPALDRARGLLDTPGIEPVWQFHIALSLLHRGEADALPRALAAVRAPTERWYFRRADWEALVGAANIVTCSLALADASHHHAYQKAVQTLLSLTRPTPDVRDALVRFLEVDANRPLHLRFATARYLARHFNDATGLPLLVEEMCDEPNAQSHATFDDLPDTARVPAIEAVADAALVGGPSACSEKRLWWLLQWTRTRGMPADAIAALDLRLFESGSSSAIRRAAAQYAVTHGLRNARLHRVAEVFAWGVRRGVELTGRLFKFHLTSKETDFGHTRLDGSHIFVSPLPMLREETHGQDIVEGLVLHELGHHVYHRSEEAQKLWKQAHDEGIGHFLNLIADEHLERNLRALDPAYGDRLKRLGAYAFQHAPQEMKLSMLCDSLGAATATALIAADLGVAFDEARVRVRRGAILTELDRTGHPVARFSRALRMGLGNRAGDPLIAQALALCGKDLRGHDMAGLYELTKKLVELFGGKVEICKIFGGPEGLEFGERDDDVFGAGVDDDILQREIERILEPKRGGTKKAGPRDRLAINVNPATDFDKITTVQRVRGDQDVHRKLATQVKRHSTRLATYLDELGLKWKPVRARTQGRAIDRTRLRALVTRNDPRILVARTPLRMTDLFLGVIVDCSGSMQARDNIDRARRFAVLVAEAVRPLEGVAARFFGFTDSVIYDAGDKNDCNVVALHADGGNNDAAALYHAANVALAAPQRAKVLIMISDGLPTECSVESLRALVAELTRRRGIVCAQVGVIKLQEICFPHYVLIDDDQLDIAVAKFGRMIADLARRSLGAS